MTQGAQTALFTTSTPYLEVTQLIQGEPLLVNVACLCEEGLTNNIEDDVKIDLDTSNIEFLGAVGNVSINYPCFENPQTNQGCFLESKPAYFTFLTEQYLNDYIEFTYVLVPPTLGTITDIADNGIKVDWNSQGIGRLTVTAVNICSGQADTEFVDINVEP